MKTAEIYSAPLTQSGLFGWKWRSQAHNAESGHWFVFYRDCVVDAKRNGYQVQTWQPQRGGDDGRIRQPYAPSAPVK